MGFNGMPLPFIFLVGNMMMGNIIISCDQSLSGCLDHHCSGDDLKAPLFPYPLGMATQGSYLADKVSITRKSNQPFCPRKPYHKERNDHLPISRVSLDDEFGICKPVAEDCHNEIGTRKDHHNRSAMVSLATLPAVTISDTEIEPTMMFRAGRLVTGDLIGYSASAGEFNSSVEITGSAYYVSFSGPPIPMKRNKFWKLSVTSETDRTKLSLDHFLGKRRFLRYFKPGIRLGLLILLTGISSYAGIYWAVRRRNFQKSKCKFFEQNGGLILEQILRSHSHKIKIFTEEELIRATNNYHEKTILGERRFGKVYKGILPDDQVVVIKETKLVHEAYVEKFIKRVIQLSQINHKNLVNLLGCCLETKVPFLVYEFVNNGSSLVQHFHHEGLESSLSKELRVKIATEIAQALAYMHSEAPTPMIHGNVNLLNILLDDNNVAKLDCEVQYFNNVVDKDKRMIAPTTGYFNPEYFLSGKITETIDVYSFGVVLKELLTPTETLPINGRPDNKRNIEILCISSMEMDDQLLRDVDEGVDNEEKMEVLKEVVNLAKMCLSKEGNDRPTMKEVAMKLEALKNIHE